MPEINHSAGILIEKDQKENNDEEEEKVVSPSAGPQLNVDPEFAEEMHKRQAEEQAAREKIIAEEKAKEAEAKEHPAEAPAENKSTKGRSKVLFSSGPHKSILVTLGLGIICGIIFTIYYSDWFVDVTIVSILKALSLGLAIVALMYLIIRTRNSSYSGDVPEKDEKIFLLSTIIPIVVISLVLSGYTSSIPNYGELIGPVLSFFVISLIHHILLRELGVYTNFMSTIYKLIILVLFFAGRIFIVTSVIKIDGLAATLFGTIGIHVASLIVADLLSMFIIFKKIN